MKHVTAAQKDTRCHTGFKPVKVWPTAKRLSEVTIETTAVTLFSSLAPPSISSSSQLARLPKKSSSLNQCFALLLLTVFDLYQLLLKLDLHEHGPLLKSDVRVCSSPCFIHPVVDYDNSRQKSETPPSIGSPYEVVRYCHYGKCQLNIPFEV